MNFLASTYARLESFKDKCDGVHPFSKVPNVTKTELFHRDFLKYFAERPNLWNISLISVSKRQQLRAAPP